MNPDAAAHLHSWETFYVIVGSSAGALTGLQFVVLTLVASVGGARDRRAAMSAYGSPTVVHFCLALLVSAALSAPWIGTRSPAFVLAVCGAAGFMYSIVVLRRAQGQRDYKPVFEDWLWHTGLPMLAYFGLFYSGVRFWPGFADALYVAGAATLLLVFIGIHNAWDTVMYVTIEGPGLGQAREGATDSTNVRESTPAQTSTTDPAPETISAGSSAPAGDPRS